MPGLNPNNPNGFPGMQTSIDFGAQEKLTQERLGIIAKYNLIGEPLSKLTKKGDKWYIGDQTVEDWESEWNRLDEKSDDDNMRGRR